MYINTFEKMYLHFRMSQQAIYLVINRVIRKRIFFFFNITNKNRAKRRNKNKSIYKKKQKERLSGRLELKHKIRQNKQTNNIRKDRENKGKKFR